ncbi:MAG: terminase small subunit [Desulfobacterales bacterium]
MAANHDKFKPGRPAKYDNCLDLQAMCEMYLEHCNEGEEIEKWSSKKGESVKIRQKIPPTKPGLAVFLGYSSRHSLKDLLNNPDFSPTLRRIFTHIENDKLVGMLMGRYNVTAGVFDLTNNADYRQRTEQEINNRLGLDELLHAIGQEDPKTANAIRDRLRVLVNRKTGTGSN